MTRLPLIISRFPSAAGRFSDLAGQILEDRLELLAFDQSLAKLKKDMTCFSIKN